MSVLIHRAESPLVSAPAASPTSRARVESAASCLSPYQLSLLPPSLLSLLSARAPSPSDSAPAALVSHTASPPRRKHGSRLQAAAKVQLSSQSRLPLKRKLEQQLGQSAHASPVRGAASVSHAAAPAVAPATTPHSSPVRLTSAAAASSSPPHAPFSMTMLRPPTAAAAAVTSTTTAASPGLTTGSTPSKRHRLDTDGLLPRLQTLQPPPSTSTAAASLHSSSSPAASPPRPFYSMPAHPLTPAELFPRRRSPSSSPSPPPARSAARSGSSRPSPSKKSLFGAMLPSPGGSGGSRKRLRDAAALTPGLHHSKGIHCFTLGEDTADDRAKKALAHRQYEEWMDSRRKAEANKKREEARNQRLQHPQRFRSQIEEEDLESDEEIELMITGRIKAANAAAATPAAAAASSAVAASSSAATAATTPLVLTASPLAVPAAEAAIVSSASIVVPSPLAALTVTAAAAHLPLPLLLPLPLPLLASSLVPLVPFCDFPAALLVPSGSASAMDAITVTPSLAPAARVSATATAPLVDDDAAVYHLAPFQSTTLVAAPLPLL